MRRYLHGEEDVAIGRAPFACAAASLDAHHLAVLHADGNLDVNLFAILQNDTARAAAGRFLETGDDLGREILAAGLARAAAAARATAAAHHLREDVLEAGCRPRLVAEAEMKSPRAGSRAAAAPAA